MDAGGYNDTFSQLALSGEPPVPELVQGLGDGPRDPTPLLDYFNLTLRLREYRERYEDYWESTASRTEKGRPVDALIMPVAPHAAVIPGGNYLTYSTSSSLRDCIGRLHLVAYSSIVDALDYPSIVIPVTTADKRVDKFDKEYKPLTDVDKKNWLACKYI